MAPQPQRPSFKRTPVPPAPAPAAPVSSDTVKKALGNLPAPAIGKMTLTPDTRKNLEVIGWQEGDPIPPDLSLRIKALSEARKQDLATATHGFAPGSKVKIGRQVNLAELPEEDQKVLRQHLADYKAEMANQAAAEAAEAAAAKRFSGAGVGVAKAALTAQTAQQRPQMPKVELRRKSQPVPLPEAPEPVPMPNPAQEAIREAVGRPEFIEMTPETAPEPENPAENAETEPQNAENTEKTGNSGLDTRPTHCPRCAWNLNDEHTAEPTVRDRQAFLATLLGAARFTKNFQILGGAYTIVLRSLHANEVDLIYKQLNCNARNGTINGEGDYFFQLETYRMVCALDRVLDREGNTMVEIPPIFDIEYDGDDAPGLVTETRLVRMVQWFNESGLPNESLRRVVAQRYRQFQRMVETMEAQAAEPGFWTGIEQQP